MTAGPVLRLEALRSALAGPFDLTIGRGECVAVTGPSGAGKSLFLRMVADLDLHEGRAWLDGVERRAYPAPSWRRGVVYVAAESGWWTEDVAAHFPAHLLGAARTLGARLGLKPELLDGPVARLSTGERQRLSLLRALVLAPPVLLLDEPTGPLDPDSVARAEALLRERLQLGTAMLVVTHDPDQVRRLGARHLQLDRGRLVPA